MAVFKAWTGNTDTEADENEHCDIGDIVAIKVRNFLLIHRVLFKRKVKNGNSYQYFTKGDRRLADDGWIDNKSIVGFVPTKAIKKCLIA